MPAEVAKLSKPEKPGKPARPVAADGREVVAVLIGVFFTFGPIGLLLQMINTPAGNWVAAITGLMVAGLISVIWAAIFIYQRFWWLVLLIPAQGYVPAKIFNTLARAGWLHPDPDVADTTRRIAMAVGSVVCMVIGYVLVLRFARRQEKLTTRFRTELDVAARMHASLVPPIEITTARLEVYGRSDASTEMGGDLIDLIVQGERTDLYLADVSGHGVRAGVLMAMVKSAIRTRLLDGVPLAAVLTGLNQVVVQVKEPPMFVTFAALRFAGPGSVEYALAGHLPVLWVSRGGEVRELAAESLPLGVEEEETFTPRRVDCGSGDLFVIYTDGLTEVMNGQGQQMGMEVFRNLIAAHAARPLPEIFTAVMGAVRAHGQQADDQTLLLARVR